MDKAKQAQAEAGIRPPVVYSKKVKAAWLEDDKFDATISRFPKRFREILSFGATVARPHISNHPFFIFEVRLDVDSHGKSIPSIEVFDEIRLLLYPSRNKRKPPPLDPTDEELARLARDFIEAFNTSQDSGKEAVLHDLLKQTGHDDLLPGETSSAAPETALPVTAPALWLDRTDRDQSPPDFIRDTYGPWLGKGLTRAHIFHLDKPLYTALAKWLRSNPLPDWLNLPTKAEQNTRRLNEIGTPSASEWLSKARQNADPATKERIRLYDAARRRVSRATVAPP